MRWTSVAALAALLAAAPGCSMFRAQVGYGLGLGVDLQVPALLHTGLAAGDFTHVGPSYGRPARARREVGLTALVWHYEGERDVTEDDWFPAESSRPKHGCWAGLPPASTYTGDKIGTDVQPYSFEIGLMLIGVDLRLGFNPVAPFRQ